MPVAHDDLVAGRVAVQGLHVRHMDRAFSDFALAAELNQEQAIGVRRREVPQGQGHDQPDGTKAGEGDGIEHLAPARLHSPHAHQPDHAGDRSADADRHPEPGIVADAV